DESCVGERASDQVIGTTEQDPAPRAGIEDARPLLDCVLLGGTSDAEQPPGVDWPNSFSAPRLQDADMIVSRWDQIIPTNALRSKKLDHGSLCVAGQHGIVSPLLARPKRAERQGASNGKGRRKGDCPPQALEAQAGKLLNHGEHEQRLERHRDLKLCW